MLRNLESGEYMTERVVFPFEELSKSKKTYFCGLDLGTPCSSSNLKYTPMYFSHNSSENEIQEECQSTSTDIFNNSKKCQVNTSNYRCTEEACDEDTCGSLKNPQGIMKQKPNGASKSDCFDKPWGYSSYGEPSSSSSLDNNSENETTEAKDIRFSDCGNCSNYEERNYANIFSEESRSIGFIVGWILIITGALLFIGTVFSVFFAPFLQPTTHNLLEFLRNDNYYCFFVPLCSPIIVLIVYANWLAMKFFLHS